MITTNSLRGRVALMVGHCAGMVDLVALPVWVGTLISVYRFDPQQAGLLATLFLAGAVLASLVLAPFFQVLPGRVVATAGFAAAAVGFAVASSTTQFSLLALLHAASGVAAGAALSVTHGTIARSHNPHRMFALVGMALGVFAIVFLGGTRCWWRSRAVRCCFRCSLASWRWGPWRQRWPSRSLIRRQNPGLHAVPLRHCRSLSGGACWALRLWGWCSP